MCAELALSSPASSFNQPYFSAFGGHKCRTIKDLFLLVPRHQDIPSVAHWALNMESPPGTEGLGLVPAPAALRRRPSLIFNPA